MTSSLSRLQSGWNERPIANSIEETSQATTNRNNSQQRTTEGLDRTQAIGRQSHSRRELMGGTKTESGVDDNARGEDGEATINWNIDGRRGGNRKRRDKQCGAAG
eukprot:scaffold157185_cov63-Cyclotella_meneghiniana.AAC.1